MLRPASPATLTCPQCEQPGMHGTVDQCIASLKRAIAGETPRPRPVPPAPPKPRPWTWPWPASASRGWRADP